jgi:hypothetical protein
MSKKGRSLLPNGQTTGSGGNPTEEHQDTNLQSVAVANAGGTQHHQSFVNFAHICFDLAPSLATTSLNSAAKNHEHNQFNH